LESDVVLANSVPRVDLEVVAKLSQELKDKIDDSDKYGQYVLGLASQANNDPKSAANYYVKAFSSKDLDPEKYAGEELEQKLQNNIRRTLAGMAFFETARLWLKDPASNYKYRAMAYRIYPQAMRPKGWDKSLVQAALATPNLADSQEKECADLVK